MGGSAYADQNENGQATAEEATTPELADTTAVTPTPAPASADDKAETSNTQPDGE